MKDKAWWFGALEYRNELGGVLVGTRNPNPAGGGTISTSSAPEPLTDPMGTLRGDWKISNRDTLTLHYGIERLNATGAASFLSGQPIGSASQRQDLNNDFQTFQASWTRVISPTLLNLKASTSSTTTCAIPWCSSSTWAFNMRSPATGS